MLEKFLLNKAKDSDRFAHLLFWYIIAGIDDSQSIQLSQHKNQETWAFLKLLIQTVESEKSKSALPFEILQLEEEFKTEEDLQLFRNTIRLPKIEEISDTGSSSIRYDYTQFSTQLDNYALMTRYDQQIIRTLSNNMSEHQIFFATPKFVSDLIHISDVLKAVQKEERNDMLKELLHQLNKNLPANVYVPIIQEDIMSQKFKSQKGGIVNHRILKI